MLRTPLGNLEAAADHARISTRGDGKTKPRQGECRGFSVGDLVFGGSRSPTQGIVFLSVLQPDVQVNHAPDLAGLRQEPVANTDASFPLLT